MPCFRGELWCRGNAPRQRTAQNARFEATDPEPTSAAVCPARFLPSPRPASRPGPLRLTPLPLDFAQGGVWFVLGPSDGVDIEAVGVAVLPVAERVGGWMSDFMFENFERSWAILGAFVKKS